jgi:hypothetical protein
MKKVDAMKILHIAIQLTLWTLLPFITGGLWTEGHYPSKENAAKAAHLHHCSRSGGDKVEIAGEFGKAGLKVKPITVRVRDGWNISIGKAQWEFGPNGAKLLHCKTDLYDWHRQ